MRKTVLIVLAMILFSCNIFASTEIILPKKFTKKPITIWNSEYQLKQEIYRYENNLFTLINPNEVEQTDLKSNKIVYYPNLIINVYVEIIENKFFSGIITIMTEPNVKVDYNLELRVDSTRSYVDLSDTPELVLTSGKLDSSGEKVNISFNTRNLDKSTEWVKKVDNSFNLNLQIRLLSKTNSIRSFNMGLPIRFGK